MYHRSREDRHALTIENERLQTDNQDIQNANRIFRTDTENHRIAYQNVWDAHGRLRQEVQDLHNEIEALRQTNQNAQFDNDDLGADNRRLHDHVQVVWA